MENTQIILGTLIPTVIILIMLIGILKETYEMKQIIGDMKKRLGKPIYGTKQDYESQFKKELADITRNRKAAIKQFRKRGK